MTKLLPNLLRQVGAYCIKRFKKHYIYLAQHYSTAIQLVPFNEALHEKAPCYIITKTDSERQECCVAELPGMLPKMTYVLSLESGCFAKTFEFQPILSRKVVLGPSLIWSPLTKTNTTPFFLHPSLILQLSLLFSKTLGRVWVFSKRFWNLAGCTKCDCHDLPMRVQRALL